MHLADRFKLLIQSASDLHGTLKQFFQMKKANRHLKTMLSIGGATYSKNFATAASTPTGRAAIVASSIGLLENYGFDGLDIDWYVVTIISHAP